MRNFIVPMSATVIIGSIGVAAYQNFSTANAEQRLQEQEIAAKNLSKAQIAHRSELLTTLVQQKRNGLITRVFFDSSGTLSKITPAIDEKKIPTTNHTMRIGMPVEGFEGNRSISIVDYKSGDYAVIGKLDGQMQILFIYSKEEVNQ